MWVENVFDVQVESLKLWASLESKHGKQVFFSRLYLNVHSKAQRKALES